ncbi:MAG: GHKL domain-containing protein [Oscillospiraceae bacterium]|nr:GHKL domain-containing protein [Oscillospiraceae bacterium]
MAISIIMPNVNLGWRIMPLFGHLPNLLFLLFYFKKRFATSVAAICTAYLMCLPPRVLFNIVDPYIPDILVLKLLVFELFIVATFLFCFKTSGTVSAIFNKDNRSVYIFASIPILFYITNYFLEIYTNFWTSSSPVITELFRFALCIAYMLFCAVYFKEYEEKRELAYKEQVINLSLEQQQKEIEMLNRTNKEIRIMRHDMRLFSNILKMCIQTNDMESAAKLADNINNRINNTYIHRYCEYNIINYILSDYAVQCDQQNVRFEAAVKLVDFEHDEIMFGSIISNALDNALRANTELPQDKRCISLALKTMDGKIYLSVRNPVAKKPVMADGLPVSNRKGHGYGTQSIQYVTEKLGGNCMFSADDKEFSVRVIL